MRQADNRTARNTSGVTGITLCWRNPGNGWSYPGITATAYGRQKTRGIDGMTLPEIREAFVELYDWRCEELGWTTNPLLLEGMWQRFSEYLREEGVI